MFRSLQNLLSFSRPSQAAVCTKRRTPSQLGQALDFAPLEKRLNFSGLSGGEAQGTFDLNLFEQNLQGQFYGSSIGFGYAIAQNGQFARGDGFGDARTVNDDPQQDFTTDTVMTIASVAKPITATAILQILQNQGQSVDQPIYSFLPQAWRQALDAPGKAAAKASIESITFRELLTHRSGIRRIDFNGDGTASLNEQTSYDGLRQLIETGINPADKLSFSYENANFALLRVMLPYIWDQVDNDDIESSDDPAGFTAGIYVQYVSENILAPMGIEDADTKPGPGDDALVYSLTQPNQPGFAWGDRTLLAGGEGWFLSPRELTAFLAHVRYNDAILSDETREMSRDGFLGWNNPELYDWSAGMFGTYFNHGGDLLNLHTGIMDFPNGIQAAVMANSDLSTANVPHLNAYSNTTPYQLERVKRAYENAWPQITIAGTSGADTFEVTRNPNDAQAIDIFMNGDLVVTRWLETLDQLILNGSGGNDTFEIAAIPGDLQIELLGGAGSDTFRIADAHTQFALTGLLEIQGGSGNDVLIFDEAAVFGAATYTITGTTLSKSTRAGLIQFSSLSQLDVHAGSLADTIRVHSQLSGTDLRLFGEGGQDSFIVGNRDLSVNLGDSIWIDGGSESDSITLDDRDGGNPLDWYLFEPTFFMQSGFAGAVHSASVESLALWATQQDSNFTVRGTQPGQSLAIYGRGGTDTLRIHETAVDSVVNFFGGSGNDTLLATPEARDLDDLRGVIGFDGGTGVDLVRFHDEADAGLQFGQPGQFTDIYQIDNSGLTRGGTFAGVSWQTVETLDLRANDHRNRILIHSLDASVDLTVRAGAGDDEILIGNASADLDTHFQGDLTLYGGSGSDLVKFNDAQDNLGNDSYSLVGGTFTKTGLQTWTYSQTEQVILNANAFDNTLLLSSLPAIELRVYGGAGNDRVDLGSERADLIRANVRVYGGSGQDDVVVNNPSAPGNLTYSFDNSEFDMSATLFGSLEINSVANFVLHAGAGSDQIHLVSTPVYLSLEINAGQGQDQIIVANGELSGVAGPLSVDAGLGTDSLVLNDADHAPGSVFTLALSQVSREGFFMSHTGLEAIDLQAGPGQDFINVYSTPATLSLEISAGAGDDRVSVSPLAMSLNTVAGPVSVTGGAGSDEVRLRDDFYGGGAGTPYNIFRNRLERNLFGGLNHAEIEVLRLFCGSGNDIVNVQEFNRETTFALYGGIGNDLFRATTDPQKQGGRVIIHGGSQNLPAGDRLQFVNLGDPEVQFEPSDDGGTFRLSYPESIYDVTFSEIETLL